MRGRKRENTEHNGTEDREMCVDNERSGTPILELMGDGQRFYHANSDNAGFFMF